MRGKKRLVRTFANEYLDDGRLQVAIRLSLALLSKRPSGFVQ